MTTGEPIFEHVFGVDAWEYRARHPVLAEHFNQRMTLRTAEVAAAVLAAYDFAGIRALVDVGGGHGALIAALGVPAPRPAGDPRRGARRRGGARAVGGGRPGDALRVRYRRLLRRRAARAATAMC